MADPTAHEQLLLELINRARLDPLAEAQRYGIELNASLPAGTITAAAKQVLAFDPKLIDAARAHSTWMLNTDSFSHTGAGGSSPGGRMAAAGYVFSGSWTWGENISWRGTTGTVDQTAYILSQHEGLFRSAGHRSNILEGDFRQVGLGAVLGEMKSNGTSYNALMTTEDFALSGSNHYITGVIYADANADNFYSVGEGRSGIAVALRSGATVLGSTTDWASGGYALALQTAGSLKISFSGASQPLASATILAGTENLKVDLVNGGKIRSSASATLADAARDLDLIGLAPINGTGTAAANAITGNAATNYLYGLDGNDTLSGGGGNDYLIGGAGADVLDGGAGNDAVSYYSSGAIGFDLAANTRSGAAVGDIYASIEYFYGSNTGNDTMTGSGASEWLYGFGGNDRLNGGVGGNDGLVGGLGADTFVFRGAFGRDRVNDFQDGVDHIAIDKAFAALTVLNNNSMAVTVHSGVNQIIVAGASAITLSAADFDFII